MTKNELYELESRAYENIERIKREQDAFRRGVEEGIAIMFKTMRDALDKEEKENAQKERE